MSNSVFATNHHHHHPPIVFYVCLTHNCDGCVLVTTHPCSLLWVSSWWSLCYPYICLHIASGHDHRTCLWSRSPHSYSWSSSSSCCSSSSHDLRFYPAHDHYGYARPWSWLPHSYSNPYILLMNSILALVCHPPSIVLRLQPAHGCDGCAHPLSWSPCFSYYPSPLLIVSLLLIISVFALPLVVITILWLLPIPTQDCDHCGHPLHRHSKLWSSWALL